MQDDDNDIDDVDDNDVDDDDVDVADCSGAVNRIFCEKHCRLVWQYERFDRDGTIECETETNFRNSTNTTFSLILP